MEHSRMTPDHWQKIEALFHAASECPPRHRAALLEQAEPDVRREVESLLARQGGEGPLDACAADLLESADVAVPGTSPPLRAMRLEPGIALGPYTVLGTLGRGGMGEVYRARDTKLDRDVAIKVLPAAFGSDPERVARFEREAKTLAALNHPNIAAIYGVEERGGVMALVLELVEGPTLADRIAQGPVHVYDALPIAAQIADALDAAHQRAIVHRDLKPSNIKLRPDGTVKVLDFGLAKRPPGVDERELIADQETSSGLTRDGVILGTVGYMSPEQAAGKPADFASDQFSFGVILFELLTGRRPFERDSSIETLFAIIRDPHQPVRSLNPAVTAEWEAILDRCLSKHPRDRYPDTRTLTAEVRHARDRWERRGPGYAEGSASAPTIAAAELRTAGVTRRRALWLAGGAAAALAVGVASWRAWTGDTGVRRLAVMPFANAANDEDLDYLSDGITESLIQQIARLPSLTVMARSTVFNFKNKPIDPREAGRQLGVDAILTGTVALRSGRLRITAELVDVSTGARLWGDTYDRQAAELVVVQDEISTAIVDAGIRLRLSGEERRALVRHPTDDPEAYEAYLRARHATFQGTEDGLVQARDLLLRATTRDPRFALAFKLLAATYVALALDGYMRPGDALPEASRHIKRAGEIDHQLAESHATLSAMAFFFDWDWPAADREWALYEGLPSGVFQTQELVGRSFQRWVLAGPGDALRVVRTLRKLDPLTNSYAVLEADYLFHAGQLDAAATAYLQAIEDELTAGALFGLAEVRYAQRRFDDALDALRRAHMTVGDDALIEAFDTARGQEGYQQIDRAAVQLELDSLRTRPETAYVSPLDFARAHAQLGNRHEAFSYFAAAFADRTPGLVFLKVDRAWDNIRADPRFDKYVRLVGLP
jgi:serine/threonine-protein kinase